MRYFLLLLASLPVLAAQHQGPCAKNAMAKVMSGQKKAVSEFSLLLPQSDNPQELHVYEVGFRKDDNLYHGEVSVEFIRGRCQSSVIRYISMLE